jgi:ubiquinone/menaquinone biosynthesis C-methylase UbiE
VLENVRRNLKVWDELHKWEADGDEWRGQAKACNVPYDDWKASVIKHLIEPYAAGRHVLEIAPGHGRWSEHIIPMCRHATLVDLGANCLDTCRRRFANWHNVDYFLTTGTTLPRYLWSRIDFVFSFDSFVHMSEPVIQAYMHEIARVLDSDGVAVLHHADIPDPTTHNQDSHPGWRSAINRATIAQLAEAAGLTVVDQLRYWDAGRGIGVPRFSDTVSILNNRTITA